jgi:hypothetical protein
VLRVLKQNHAAAAPNKEEAVLERKPKPQMTVRPANHQKQVAKTLARNVAGQ